ncbi:hypothetical protein FRC12_012354 [Ceratobasidium sp. 428]|nr:hypothetical protein FRC12_012354 [Ceratobasidium sp. 428]
MEVYNNELYKDYTVENWKTIYHFSRETQLLPNLHSLILTQNIWITNQFFYQSRLPWLILFNPPCLQNFTTCVTDAQNPPTFSAVGASCLLRSLTNACPGLQSLDLFPTTSMEPFYQDRMFISDLGEEDEGAEWFRHLLRLENLQRICTTVPTLQQAGLDVFGQLPRLEHLELTLLAENFDQDQPSLTLSPDAFPRLRQLALNRLPDLKFFKTLWRLDAVSAYLDSISIRFDKYRWPEPMSYRELYDMISIICECSPCISDLALYPPYEGKSNETSDIIYALLSSLPLTRLCFAPVTPSVLDLGNRTSIYPELRRLELPTLWTRLVDLRLIAQCFPNLDYLALELTATPQQWTDACANPATPYHSRTISLLVVDVFLHGEQHGRKVKEHEIER